MIEQAPVRDANGAQRGVVAEGAVGHRWAGRFRIFRYEVRRWREGIIPDIAEAVGGPQRLSNDPRQAQRLLDLVPSVPTPVWGRDELGAGEMWNSNSVTSWLIERTGVAAEAIPLPNRGRAPGWEAGLVIAHRQTVRLADCAAPSHVTTPTGSSRPAGVCSHPPREGDLMSERWEKKRGRHPYHEGDDAEDIGVGWKYTLTRGDKQRDVHVELAATAAMTTHLPEESQRAIQSDGWSAIVPYLGDHEPPTRIMISTTGVAAAE